MIKNPWIKGIVTGALLGGLILGSVGLVSASSDSSSTTNDSTSKAAAQCKVPGGRGHGPGMGMDLDLAALVKNGVITSAESIAIQTKIDALEASRKAEMDKVKAMTKTERDAYFKANPPEKANLLADLVTAGTITQAQADAVKTVIGGPGGADKGDHGHGGPGRGMGHGGGMDRGPANSSTTQTNTSK